MIKGTQRFQPVNQLQVGFTLIEVLIAWSISLTLMLIILTMNNNFLRDVHHCYLETVAVNRLEEMLERLHANTTESSREKAFEQWNQDNKILLPEGNGTLNCNNSSRICTTTIDWQEQDHQTLSVQALI